MWQKRITQKLRKPLGFIESKTPDSIKQDFKPRPKKYIFKSLENLLVVSILIATSNLCANTPSIPSIDESSEDTLYDVLWGRAAHEVSAMMFYQQAFGDDLTYLDGSFLGYYQTGRFNGFKGAGGMILAGPLFVVQGHSHETYDDVKQIFLVNTLYMDYENEHLGLKATAGRYKAGEEWNTYYSQGFGVTYDIGELASVNLSASYGSAMIINEYVTSFRSDLSSFGTYFLRSRFHLPYHIDLEPYVYVTGYFTAFGMKASIDYELASHIEAKSKLHIVGYAKYYPLTTHAGGNHKFELASTLGLGNQNMASIAWLEQEVEFYDLLEGKAGIIGTSSAGAELIDYYGHTTPFEYNVGMFYGNALTLYASAGMNWNHLFEVEAGVRQSFLPSGNITSFELKGESDFPIWQRRNTDGSYTTYMSAKVGISAIGVYNRSNAINFYGGDNYTLVRGFVRVSI